MIDNNHTTTDFAINRAIIVDDEESGRIMLRYALSAKKNWVIVGEFNNVAAAREFLKTQEVDVIFLDIQMPRENGTGLARSVSDMERPPLIIFVTAFNTHAIEAFEVHALDYLLKPVGPARFTQALSRADEILTQRRGYAKALRSYVDREEQANDTITNAGNYLQQIVARSVGEMECIALSEVLWMSSAGNYVELHLDKRVVLHRMALSAIEKLINPKDFIRVHRSAIVRTDQFQHIKVIGDGSYRLTLLCGAEVTVSERHIEQVRGFFKELQGSE
ncbi:LytR/AlgR family response regulator transcription factor [Solimicrobium silvestre]|uniref:Response regulator of the LytR/AlgR family n=1 Tax=Solimicrobium silvestre TaxID=2099400 RepID=A0A2S9GXP3_9BURK|nr:LytTR family DNA-binding domain-containing protein [Solimicrobium silvestre]PRC92492.1 Response regulator of the LytR/AlgR family [Solimicrobium silvestre]